MKLTIKLFTLFLFTHSFSFGQMAKYEYKRELKGISQQWHQIVLPEDVFSKTSQNLKDIRLFGITANGDTLEAPYVLQVEEEEITDHQVSFKTLNTVHNKKGYYFTFEIPSIEPVNQLKLDFKQKNFDWKVTLEGSQNQEEWFTVLDDYRIVAIKNAATDFQFTNLVFPSTKYRFFRVLIESKEKPELTKASIVQYEITAGIFNNFAIKKIETEENRKNKQTEIDIEMQMPVRVSNISFTILGAFDYYRPVTIKYLTDSIKTEQGWKYNYKTLTSGMLTSIERNDFKFQSTTLQKLKVIIDNQDNQPLTIRSVNVKGYVHTFVARFSEPATYFLTYGNINAGNASYDINRFADKIPKMLTKVEVGNEVEIEKTISPVTKPLFENSNWLWIIMTIIILLLGWFSLKMIRKT